MKDATPELPALVGALYAQADPVARGRLLEHLLAPLGILSLVAIANGVFARLTFANGWSRLRIRPEDTFFVDSQDVVALASRVEQVGAQALDGLSQWVGSSPLLAGSTAAVMLVALLAQQRRRMALASPDDFDPAP